MKRTFVLGAIIAIGALSMATSAFQGAAAGGRQGGPNVAQIQKVTDTLYMITGGGGNTAAFVTDGGVVIVDTKLANWGQAILDKVRTVSDKPISLIINTHTHPDHTGSNEFFGPTVDVVAQENTKTYMQNMDAFKGAGARFLPKRTFKDTMKIGSGKDEIDLYYFGRAHTGGDAWVLFRTPRVVHAGDAFAGKNIPLVDTGNGGSMVEYGKTLAKAAAGLKDYDTIITGHSTLMKPADLKEYADFNNDFVAWVQSEMKAGKTADQAAG
ncbi:MAG TPA: MBL fold metallo-hydrolase, partial [Vicinamibacterales bacterium]|nr:MBL fold metallo-hydrolase [Vicinamibacterales bacterium]